MAEKETYFKIDGRIVLALLQYLATKPYSEVNTVVPLLQRLEQIKGGEEVPCPEKIEKKLKKEAKEAKIGNSQQ